jgi:hypothetical protein
VPRLLKDSRSRRLKKKKSGTTKLGVSDDLGFGCLKGGRTWVGASVTSLQLPFSAPHMGEVEHSEVNSMSKVSDSAGTENASSAT